jgi:hypothetical protein
MTTKDELIAARLRRLAQTSDAQLHTGEGGEAVRTGKSGSLTVGMMGRKAREIVTPFSQQARFALVAYVHRVSRNKRSMLPTHPKFWTNVQNFCFGLGCVRNPIIFSFLSEFLGVFASS